MNIPTATQPADLAESRKFLKRCLSSPADLPVSFVLDGIKIQGIPETWNPVTQKDESDDKITTTTFEGQDPTTGLAIRVEVTEYQDFPVVEWVAWFTNTGPEKSPVISDILVMDGTFIGASPVLHHCNGDFNTRESYTCEESPIPVGETLTYAPHGGRSCDSAYPYYRLVFEDSGLSLAIGWPGQWSASFASLEDGVHVKARQETVHIRLKPGEQIRTPRMTAMFWSGDDSRAVNLWRRWYLAHILPRPNGQPLKPLLAISAPGPGEEHTGSSEENQLKHIELAQERGIPFELWWIDAGWYPCWDEKLSVNMWRTTGNWELDPKRFPNGLKPVSDAVSRHGGSLLLWFEPERVFPGTTFAVEHPEWVLLSENEDWGFTGNGHLFAGSGVLNLGDPECRAWLTDFICQMIEENGIRIYRQDFNIVPLPQWRDNDTEDRQGMTENLYVQGYLQFWDDLLERNPGLWIDSCASGGRRNDLETMRRSVPLHYVDWGYANDPSVKTAYHNTMFQWLPYFKECTISKDVESHRWFPERIDTYSYHCGMAPMFMPCLDVNREDLDYAEVRRMIGIWQRASDLLLNGDYYPHTQFSRSDTEWDVLQFDSPENGCGIIQGIRYPLSEDETITIQPSGIDQNALYRFENSETGEIRELKGADLINAGFTIGLEQRSCVIWFYTKLIS